MIKARHKPLQEIVNMVRPYLRVLVLGCDSCAAICFAGGEREVSIMTSSLKLKFPEKEFLQGTVKRQCEWEFLEQIASVIAQAEVVLSLSCGVGVQAIAERFPEKEVLPGNDTLFLGLSPNFGKFSERCVACGDCLLYLTGGLCPLSRCPKRLLNGPCGGVKDGSCELSRDLPCIWLKIIDRMERLGRLSLLEKIHPPADWRGQETLGPRSFIR